METLAMFKEYEKISDDIMYLGDNAVLRFNTTLGSKGLDTKKKSFHSEYKYKSNKYSDIKNLRTIRRHFDYYLSVENFKQNENYEKEYIKITINELFILKASLKQATNWFFSKEYEKLYAKKYNNLVMVGKVNSIAIPLKNKYIELEPIVTISEDGEDTKGVRMYLSSKNNFTDISIDKFMGFIYTIDTINMYQAALEQINYLQRPELGYNIYSFNDQDYIIQDEYKEKIESNTSRKIPTKKRSFFDSMKDLES